MHVLDLLQNSLEAGATAVSVLIEEDSRMDRMVIEVSDNGRGMPPTMAAEAADPFVTSRTARRVGLGLPLLAAAAERCGGRLAIDSAVGVGTKVTASFVLSHIDRAPLGDMTSTLLAVLLQEPPVALTYRHRVDDRVFSFTTAAITAELGDVPLSHPAVLRWLREFLADGFAYIYRGGADAYDTIDGGAAPA